MAGTASDAQLQRLAEGFNSLLDEYNWLLSRSQQLENSLKNARSQFTYLVPRPNAVDKSGVLESTILQTDNEDRSRVQASQEKWWMRTDLPMQKENLARTRCAIEAVQNLRLEKKNLDDDASKISSEVVATGVSSAMPSIVESPLEQDFTTVGTPSRLGCPFASMTNRRLSAHAASVVSRYRPTGIMTPRSSTSRINGRPNDMLRSPLPVMNGADTPTEDDSALMKKTTNDIEASIQGSIPQCPIRFLDKNSPEEVAEYFEKHKHELPRSHEVCVKRYQSNTQSIRQLDAKYGNLVSMIQGLGQKHVPMLPEKQELKHDSDEDAEADDIGAERVMKWASNVDNVDEAAAESPEVDERESRFDRPMKDVRLGESPSRPWGIQVPLNAVENIVDTRTDTQGVSVSKGLQPADGKAERTKGGCPFAHGAPPGMINPHLDEASADKDDAQQASHRQGQCNAAASQQDDKRNMSTEARPVFLAAAGIRHGTEMAAGKSAMVFSGPVFIGYSPEQAAAVIKALRSNE